MRALAIVLLVLAGCGAGETGKPVDCGPYPEWTVTCQYDAPAPESRVVRCEAGKLVLVDECDPSAGYYCNACPGAPACMPGGAPCP